MNKRSEPADVTRCPWCVGDPLYIRYHDEEWGVPEYDDDRLFEMLCLEGQQAGLSWITVLRKRDGYRKRFRNFEIDAVARLNARSVDAAISDANVIRHRGKLESIISNARAARGLREQTGSLSDYLWSFVNGSQVTSRWTSMKDVPAQTEQSTALSKDLKRRGFRFVGPTTCYAFMQACGMVNDHLMNCFRHKECAPGA